MGQNTPLNVAYCISRNGRVGSTSSKAKHLTSEIHHVKGCLQVG